jgi:predicted MPP superfamily phosphohydrolase
VCWPRFNVDELQRAQMIVQTKRKLIIAAIAGVGIAYALFFEKYFFQVKTFHIGKKRGDRKIKLLLLSDLHFKKFLDAAYIKLAKKINSYNPDLIMIAGDLIDEDGQYAPAKAFFNLVKKTIPKVAIMGNHDHKSRVKMKTYRQLYAQNNGTLLVNESVSMNIAGKCLMITGVDDFIEGNPSFPDAVKAVGREENHLLLLHSPLQQETVLRELKALNLQRSANQQLNIQYIFAGHNHGGQVRFFGFAPIMPLKSGDYLKGWYNDVAPYLYLSRGFGTSTLPFRFGSRSEVTIFYLGV